MTILRKGNLRKTFAQEGCAFPQHIYPIVDALIQDLLTDTAIRSKKILDVWKRKRLTKEAFELAYDQHKQTHVAEITKTIIGSLKYQLDRRGEEIANQYGKGTQLNPKAIK